MARLLLCVSTLLLAACSSTGYWTKPGASQAQFDADSYACVRENMYSSGVLVGTKAALVGSQSADLDVGMYKACLRARGWQEMPTVEAGAILAVSAAGRPPCPADYMLKGPLCVPYNREMSEWTAE